MSERVSFVRMVVVVFAVGVVLVMLCFVGLTSTVFVITLINYTTCMHNWHTMSPRSCMKTSCYQILLIMSIA